MGDGDQGFPMQIDQISAEWLTTVLDDRFGPIETIDVERIAEGVGFLGELARITPTYAAGSSGPATLIAKCQAPLEENRALGVAMGFYLREVNFYRHVATELDVRVPEPYHVAAGDSGVPFILLMEDIAGASCPDQLAGIGDDDVKRIMSALLPLHVRYWGTDDLHRLDWLPPMNNDLYKGAQALGQALWDPFVERFGERVGDEMLATLRATIDAYPQLLDHLVSLGTPTFTHTDCRAQNYLIGGDGRDDEITVVDFQLSTRHWGMWDLSNLIAGSMTPADRRAHDQSIIEWYVGELAANGVADYEPHQARLEYRWCLLQQAVAGLIVSDLQATNDEGVELLEELFMRPIEAAKDNDVHELVTEFT